MVKTIEMERDKNETSPDNNNNSNYPDQFVDEVTREKIRKHINDPDDKITEQDIANVNTDIFKRSDEEMSDEALKGSKTTEPDEEIAPKAPNTWDILEE